MTKIALALVCFTLLACSSSGDSSGTGSSSRAKLLRPEVELFQLAGPADQQYPSGQIEVQYAIRVSNRSSEPITLRQVQVESVGEGGSYRLRKETYFFRRELPGSQSTDVVFWARATATGDAFAIDAQAPITVRGVAYFESPAGNLRTVFVKNLNQSSSSRR